MGLVDRTGLGASGQDVATEFQEVMDQLDASVRANLIFGVTDTPSANRKAWRLLMDANQRMYWGGCMAHEISLYMGDVAKMECSKRLMDNGFFKGTRHQTDSFSYVPVGWQLAS